MSRSILPYLTFTSLILGRVKALTAIQGSPCYDPCNGSESASASDIVCTDDELTNSTTGAILNECLQCLHTSDYRAGWMSDSILYFYYVSTVQQTCLSDTLQEPIDTCSNDCSDVGGAFSNMGGRNFFQNPYAYCTANDDAYTNQATTCTECLQSQEGSVILGNFVAAGKAGCDEQPNLQSGQTIDLPRDLFDTDVIDSGESGSNSSSKPVSSPVSGSATAAASTSTAPTSSTISSTTAVSSAASSASAASASSSQDEDNRSEGLSRGAAAGVGIAVGLLGIATIVFFAIFVRRRMMKRGPGGMGAGTWKKMRDGRPGSRNPPAMAERGATPPAAGVFVPASTSASAPAPAPARAPAAVPKTSKSFKSAAGKSSRSFLTPRTSEWFYAANPKQSSDLSALPQKGWD